MLSQTNLVVVFSLLYAISWRTSFSDSLWAPKSDCSKSFKTASSKNWTLYII